MTLAEMMNEINALGRNIRAAADRLMADAADNTHDMQDIERQQNALRDMNNRMAALRLAYTTQEDAERGNLTALQGSGSPARHAGKPRICQRLRARDSHRRKARTRPVCGQAQGAL